MITQFTKCLFAASLSLGLAAWPDGATLHAAGRTAHLQSRHSPRQRVHRPPRLRPLHRPQRPLRCKSRKEPPFDHFNYDADGQLQAEQLPLQQLADQYGTMLYVYSRATLERHWHAFDQAAGDIPHLICYAVKANPTWPCSICWHAWVRGLTSSPAASCPGAGGGR